MPNSGVRQLQELGDQGFVLIQEDKFGRKTFNRRKPIPEKTMAASGRDRLET